MIIINPIQVYLFKSYESQKFEKKMECGSELGIRDGGGSADREFQCWNRQKPPTCQRVMIQNRNKTWDRGGKSGSSLWAGTGCSQGWEAGRFSRTETDHRWGGPHRIIRTEEHRSGQEQGRSATGKRSRSKCWRIRHGVKTKSCKGTETIWWWACVWEPSIYLDNSRWWAGEISSAYRRCGCRGGWADVEITVGEMLW